MSDPRRPYPPSRSISRTPQPPDLARPLESCPSKRIIYAGITAREALLHLCNDENSCISSSPGFRQSSSTNGQAGTDWGRRQPRRNWASNGGNKNASHQYCYGNSDTRRGSRRTRFKGGDDLVFIISSAHVFGRGRRG